MTAAVTVTQGVLYASGALVEFIGITLVAAPDLVPGTRRLSRWIAPRWRRLENRLRRLLRLTPRSITHSVGMTGTIEAGASISGVKSIGLGPASLEQKVSFSCDGTRRRRRKSTRSWSA